MESDTDVRQTNVCEILYAEDDSLEIPLTVAID